MKCMIITVKTDATEFKVPTGYEPFHIVRNAHEWVVFIRPSAR